MVLETAVNGFADALFTFNLADLSDAAVQFGIRALRPASFVRIVESDRRRSNVALRLLPSLLDAAREVARREGVALNQLIDVAVAEKLSAIRTGLIARRRR